LHLDSDGFLLDFEEVLLVFGNTLKQLVHVPSQFFGLELALRVFVVLGVKGVEQHAEVLPGVLGEVVVDVDDGVEVELGLAVGL
jgi:hypothetical protein